jgi:hypothetical protein
MSTVLNPAGFQQEAMEAYFREGEARALALGNRGPIRFGPDGKLLPDIVDAYLRTGFYVFEGVIAPGELAELKAEFFALLDRAPTGPGSKVDRHGRPALGLDREGPFVSWAKPLSDPFGGTAMSNGRHPVKMEVPPPPEGLPKEVPLALMAPLEFSEAALRMSAHPDLLGVAATINGEDFVPFSETFIVKKPGEGAAFAWHQDGTTHWEAEDWSPQTHGFNFMIQMFDCTAANAIWWVPGTHATGRVDIRQAVREAGSNRLPGAVPLICKAGDVAISNRQILHGSFANNSPDWRVTFNIGCHRRKSVVGVHACGIGGVWQTYDEERVARRSEMIGYAIAARRQRFPDETPFVYRPHAAAGRSFAWDDAARRAIVDYDKLDLFI